MCSSCYTVHTARFGRLPKTSLIAVYERLVPLHSVDSLMQVYHNLRRRFQRWPLSPSACIQLPRGGKWRTSFPTSLAPCLSVTVLNHRVSKPRHLPPKVRGPFHQRLAFRLLVCGVGFLWGPSGTGSLRASNADAVGKTRLRAPAVSSWVWASFRRQRVKYLVIRLRNVGNVAILQTPSADGANSQARSSSNPHTGPLIPARPRLIPGG
jgi:hypothetical protein